MQTLLYFHDPMCSWCWGYRPTWLKLEALLSSTVPIEYCLGGLAPDSNIEMSQALADKIKSHWQRIENQLGTEFNYNFWTDCKPRRSTYPACRAVIAAKKQNAEREMILAIQQAYYLKAKNPSNQDVLIGIAEALGLNLACFKVDNSSVETERDLISQISLTKELKAPGFPALILKQGSQFHHIPVDYKDSSTSYNYIKDLVKNQ